MSMTLARVMTDSEREIRYLEVLRKQLWRTFPIITGEVVQEGHARYCADKGHSKWHRPNWFGQLKLQSQCPNCGDHVWNPDTGEYTRVCLVKR